MLMLLRASYIENSSLVPSQIHVVYLSIAREDTVGKLIYTDPLLREQALYSVQCTVYTTLVSN